jgi:hypothetical protein
MYNKKFWEQLVAYFTLKQHAPHRKRLVLPILLSLRYVFVDEVRRIPSHCLEISGGGGTHKQESKEMTCAHIYIFIFIQNKGSKLKKTGITYAYHVHSIKTAVA